MYYCNNCKTLFDDPNHKTISHGEIDGNWGERYSVCPNCGSEDFETARRCECCDEWLDQDIKSEIYEDYCVVCEDRLNTAMDVAITMLGEDGIDFSKAVRLIEMWSAKHW